MKLSGTISDKINYRSTVCKLIFRYVELQAYIINYYY